MNNSNNGPWLRNKRNCKLLPNRVEIVAAHLRNQALGISPKREKSLERP